MLDIGSLVPSCDAFVSRVGRGDAISLSVNIPGGGFALFLVFFGFFFVQYQIHNEICEDTVDSNAKMEASDARGCGKHWGTGVWKKVPCDVVCVP